MLGCGVTPRNFSYHYLVFYLDFYLPSDNVDVLGHVSPSSLEVDYPVDVWWRGRGGREGCCWIELLGVPTYREALKRARSSGCRLNSAARQDDDGVPVNRDVSVTLVRCARSEVSCGSGGGF